MSVKRHTIEKTKEKLVKEARALLLKLEKQALLVPLGLEGGEDSWF